MKIDVDRTAAWNDPDALRITMPLEELVALPSAAGVALEALRALLLAMDAAVCGAGMPLPPKEGACDASL